MTLAPRIASRMAFLSLLLAVPAQAQNGDRVEVDTNLICDTQQQVERFVSLFESAKGSAEVAIEGVNAEYDTPNACVIATTAFQRGGPVATVKSAQATFNVTRITVVGVYTINGMERSKPTEFFTLFAQDEDATVGRRP